MRHFLADNLEYSVLSCIEPCAPDDRLILKKIIRFSEATI